MKKKKIYSFNSELYKVTGVQKVVMDVHHAVCEEYEAKIVGTVPFEKLHKDLQIKEDEYVRMKSPFMFRGSIVIVHERKYLMMFWLLNKFLFQHITIVYIHHNMLYGHKLTTKLPRHIVAISDAGIKNLTEYFKVPIEHITKIYNCVRDIHPEEHPLPTGDKITLLLPARINDMKQQVEIVKHLKDKLSHNIKILFAGVGPNYEALKKECEGDNRFVPLGFRSDVYALLHKCDYMLLYSIVEGLPITLIEADMMGTPVVCNDVGGNTEIVHDGENGFIVNTWDELAERLNSLPAVKNDEYKRMSQRGREIYEHNFTFDKFKENYLRMIRAIDKG